MGDRRRGDLLVMLVTATLCIWNVAVGFLVGLALNYLLARVTPPSGKQKGRALSLKHL